MQRVAAVNCTLVLWAGLSDIEAKPFIHLKYIYHFIMRRSFTRDNSPANNEFPVKIVGFEEEEEEGEESCEFFFFSFREEHDDGLDKNETFGKRLGVRRILRKISYVCIP